MTDTKTDAKAGPGAVLRPLDGLESVVMLFEQTFHFNVVIMARIRGPLTPDVVRRALDDVQRRHALLRVRIREDPDGPVWVEGVPPVSLLVEPRVNDTTWMETACRDVDVPIDIHTGPLGAATLLQGDGVHDFLFRFHHIIGDGESAFKFLNDFMEAAAAAAEGRSMAWEPLPLPPALRDLSPRRPGTPETKRAIRKQFLKWIPLMFPPPAKLRSDAGAPGEKPRTWLHHRNLTVQETTDLAALCRANGTTVTGAAAAAFLLAIADDHGKRAKFRLVIPVNLRSELPGVDEKTRASLSLYVSALNMAHKVTPGEDFWALARTMRGRMQEEQESGAHWNSAAYMEEAAPRLLKPGRMARFGERAANITNLVITNAGRLQAPERVGPFRWEAYTSVASCDTPNASFICAVITFNGAMMFNVLHPRPAVNLERGARMADAIFARLRPPRGSVPGKGAPAAPQAEAKH